MRAQARFLNSGDLFSGDEKWWPAARDVRSVKLRYFDGKDWHEEWDSSDKVELPRAVSVEIMFETEATNRALFMNTIRIACRNGDVNDAIVRTTRSNE